MNQSQFTPSVISDITVETTPPTPGTLTAQGIEGTSNQTVTAGKSKVTIENLGFVVSGDLEVAATITTPVGSFDIAPKSPPFSFVKNFDRVNNIEELLPEISVTTNGARVRIIVES